MKDDDGIIDLRSQSEPEFKINRNIGEPVTSADQSAMAPHDKVKVRFDKFVNLLASHAYEDVLETHSDEEVIISTNLLADIANAHEETKDRKLPVILLVGILIGVVVAWLLLRG